MPKLSKLALEGAKSIQRSASLQGAYLPSSTLASCLLSTCHACKRAIESICRGLYVKTFNLIQPRRPHPIQKPAWHQRRRLSPLQLGFVSIACPGNREILWTNDRIHLQREKHFHSR